MLAWLMDAHPVPQNVTQFQFRLIGDMTLKQFGYLAGGVGFAYLIFVFLSGAYPWVAWPVIVISSFLGIAFAFLPIQDRPLDHWVGAFIKAIYSPTKREWKKSGKSYKDDPTFRNRLGVYLTVQRAMAQPLLPSIPHPVQFKPIQPVPPIVPVTHQATPPPQIIHTPPPPIAPNVIHASPLSGPKMPTSEELSKTVDLGKQAQSLQMKIIAQEKELSKIKTEAAQGIVSPAEYTRQFNTIFEQLQQLVQEASEIKRKLDSVTTPEIQKPKIKVEVVKPKLATPTPITLTSTPNVISGIIVDTEGNYLDAVVVVIHDKDNLPVRALKTNKLGQFTGSTPLSNGTFNIELEKDGYAFDVQQVELSGQVLPPMMVSAKSAVGSS